MSGEIRNRVAENKKIITLNLEDYYVNGPRFLVDISQWLEGGFILREQSYRKQLDLHDWEQYKDGYVAVTCTTDAILPVWAYMLFVTKAVAFAKQVVKGDLSTLEMILYEKELQQLDMESLRSKMVIVKGCSNKPVPESAYLAVCQLIIPHVKGVMYGEACSAVPLYKKNKK